MSVWTERAREILDAVDLESGDEAIIQVDLAVAFLKAGMGDFPAGELDELSRFFSDGGRDCICSPEQLARGGFRGGCPVHSSAATESPGV